MADSSIYSRIEAVLPVLPSFIPAASPRVPALGRVRELEQDPDRQATGTIAAVVKALEIEIAAGLRRLKIGVGEREPAELGKLIARMIVG